MPSKQDTQQTGRGTRASSDALPPMLTRKSRAGSTASLTSQGTRAPSGSLSNLHEGQMETTGRPSLAQGKRSCSNWETLRYGCMTFVDEIEGAVEGDPIRLSQLRSKSFRATRTAVISPVIEGEEMQSGSRKQLNFANPVGVAGAGLGSSGKLGDQADAVDDAGPPSNPTPRDEHGMALWQYEKESCSENHEDQPYVFVPAKYKLRGNPGAVVDVLKAAGVCDVSMIFNFENSRKAVDKNAVYRVGRRLHMTEKEIKWGDLNRLVVDDETAKSAVNNDVSCSIAPVPYAPSGGHTRGYSVPNVTFRGTSVDDEKRPVMENKKSWLAVSPQGSTGSATDNVGSTLPIPCGSAVVASRSAGAIAPTSMPSDDFVSGAIQTVVSGGNAITGGIFSSSWAKPPAPKEGPPEKETPGVVVVSPAADSCNQMGLKERLTPLLHAMVNTAKEAEAVIVMDDAFQANEIIPLFPDDVRTNNGILIGMFTLDDIAPGLQRTQHLKERTAGTQNELSVKTLFPRDNPKVPHEGLSKVIIFEKHEQRVIFERLLATEIHCGTVLVNGTPKGFRDSVKVLREGRPLFVFDRTGGAAELLSRVIRFKKRDLKKQKMSGGKKGNRMPAELKLKEIDSVAVGYSWANYFADDEANWSELNRNGPEIALNEDIKLSDWTTWNKINNFGKLPSEMLPYDAMCKAQTIVKHWPERYNDDFTVVVDTYNATAAWLTGKLTSIMEKSYENVGMNEFLGREANEQLIHQSLAQYNVLVKVKNRYFKTAIALGLLVIVLTFFTMYVSMTFLGCDEGVKCQWEAHLLCSDKYIDDLEKATIYLPIVVSFLMGIVSYWNPKERWAAVNLAAVKALSEIYKFRMKVGVYASGRSRLSTKCSTADEYREMMDKAAWSARTHLAAELNRILESAGDNLTDGYVNPALPLARSHTEQLAEQLARDWEEKENTRSFLNQMVGSSFGDSRIDMESDSEGEYDLSNETDQVRIVRKQHLDGGVPSAGRKYIRQWVVGDDDQISTLLAPQYVDWRLLSELERLKWWAPIWTWLHRVFVVVTLLITGISAYLASQKEVTRIPMALASAAGVQQIIDLLSLQNRVAGIGATILVLTKTHIWWQGLTHVQRRQLVYKEKLCNTVEAALIEQVANLTAVPTNMHAPGKEETNDEEADNAGNTNLTVGCSL